MEVENTGNMGDHTPSAEHFPLVVADGPMEVSSFSEQLDHSNGNAVPAETSGEEQPQPEVLSAPLTEEDRLWSTVKDNSADFNAWTALISETEKLESIEKIRKVYDMFLAEFPLCYGYWKKYADHEARLGSPEKIWEVYERAVQAVTYSVDIWMHYCTYAMSKYEDPDDIRRLFERGLSYVGSDYLSHLLWDKYLEFENTQGDVSGVAQILTRTLQLPIQQLDRFYNSFKNLVTTHSVQDLRSPEENAAAAAAAAAAAEAGVTEEASAPEVGMEGPVEGEDAQKAEHISGWSESAEMEKFVGEREALYKVAKEQDAKIRDFESSIRRPYFHVKPLDDVQLANWHHYLDLIEKEADFNKTVKLYERCLIACANYPEYWIRYVQRMDFEGSIEYATDALNRATQIFVKRRPEIHLFAATFKEVHGDVGGARSEYELLNSMLAVGLLEAVIKSANFEQRQGNMEGACSIFESAIEHEKSKEDSRSLPLLFIQYARFLDQVALQTEKAREVYSAALGLLPLSKTLWEAAILYESLHPGNKAVDYLDSLVELATAPSRPDGSQGLNAVDREEISSIFLEFVDLFGDIQAIKKAESRHRQLFPLRKTSGESKKRPSPESNVSDRGKVQKPYTATQTSASPAQAGVQVHANGQAQWGAGYGPQGYAQQPQNWQQPPPQQAQVQPQQWNPGYNNQQAAYGAYGNYGTYGPQQTAPPQQQPAYGGYGQNYAPQAFPQQNYVQPAPSYTPQQQQAPPQQGYYSGYY